MLTALFSHTEVGAELFTDSMLTCTLTLILGPFLGDDAEGERDVREMGCVALRTFFAEGDGYVGRGRACKTIVSVLTDSRASLSCTYGGLRGLQVIAPYMETDLVHVFRPAVINSLSARLALLHTDELEHMRQLVLDTLTLLSPPPAKPCDDALSLALI